MLILLPRGIGLRKSDHLSEPLKDYPFVSMSGKPLKGIHWQLDKLGLKVVFCLDKNDGESHFAELGSSWPGEAKTWPKIALRVGGRAEYSVLEDGRPNSVPPPVPQHTIFRLSSNT